MLNSEVAQRHIFHSYYVICLQRRLGLESAVSEMHSGPRPTFSICLCISLYYITAATSPAERTLAAAAAPRLLEPSPPGI